MTLEATNIIYREPDLYDRMFGDDDGPARAVVGLVDAHGPASARTLLDLGCGTARDLAHLADRFSCVGVDLQVGMIDYARRTRPQLDLRVGDMRSVRLARTLDVITCLGNSLSYLHPATDLAAAFVTFAAHAHAGTLLIIQTLVAGSGGRPPSTSITEMAGVRAEVTVSTDWDLREQILTMRRHWSFAGGRQETDVIRRRVIFPRELELLLGLSGFDVIEMLDRPDARGAALTGPSAYVVARLR